MSGSTGAVLGYADVSGTIAWSIRTAVGAQLLRATADGLYVAVAAAEHVILYKVPTTPIVSTPPDLAVTSSRLTIRETGGFLEWNLSVTGTTKGRLDHLSVQVVVDFSEGNPYDFGTKRAPFADDGPPAFTIRGREKTDDLSEWVLEILGELAKPDPTRNDIPVRAVQVTVTILQAADSQEALKDVETLRWTESQFRTNRYPPPPPPPPFYARFTLAFLISLLPLWIIIGAALAGAGILVRGRRRRREMLASYAEQPTKATRAKQERVTWRPAPISETKAPEIQIGGMGDDAMPGAAGKGAKADADGAVARTPRRTPARGPATGPVPRMREPAALDLGGTASGDEGPAPERLPQVDVRKAVAAMAAAQGMERIGTVTKEEATREIAPQPAPAAEEGQQEAEEAPVPSRSPPRGGASWMTATPTLPKRDDGTGVASPAAGRAAPQRQQPPARPGAPGGREAAPGWMKAPPLPKSDDGTGIPTPAAGRAQPQRPPPSPSPAPAPAPTPATEERKALQRVRCPNCKSIIPIYEATRPLVITCPSCGVQGQIG